MKTTTITEKKLKFLMTYAISSTLVGTFIMLNSFKSKDNVQKFDEIEVKRITVLGEDNLPRMVLSNETRQHSGRINGEEKDKRERPSGIIFFNNQGDECGGIIHQSKIKEGKIISGMSFTMDNYNDDQVVQILNDEYYEDGKAYIQRGININQYPVGSNLAERNKKIAEINKIADKNERNQKLNALWEKEGSVNRLFIGRTKGNGSGLFLSGPDGKPKMMIYVDDKGNPKIQTFNENGEIKDFIENK
jgi:phosphopantetheine adenylyltransferase